MRRGYFFGLALAMFGCTGILGSFDVSDTASTNDGGGNPDGSNPTDGSNPNDGNPNDDGGTTPTGDFVFTALANQVGFHDGSSVVDANGNIFATSSSNGPVTINGTTYTPSGGPIFFVLKLDPTGKTVLWVKAFQQSSNIYVEALSTDTAGNLYAAGAFQGASMTLGGPTATLTNPAYDTGLAGLVFSLDGATGAPRWAMTPDYAPTTGDQCFGVSARGPAGEVAITCTYSGGIHLEPISGPYVNYTAVGAGDSIVAVLDSGSGRTAWSKAITGDSYERTRGLARDKDGNVYLQGASTSTSIGDGTFALLRPAGSTNGFAYMLKVDDAAPHAISASHAFGTGGSGFIEDGKIAALSDGTIVSCMGWHGTVDFGKGAITSKGPDNATQDAVAVGMTATGTPMFVLPWGGVFGENCEGIAADESGYAVIVDHRDSAAVSIGGKALLDPPPRNASGSRAGDVIKIDSKGNVVWAFTITSDGVGTQDTATSVSIVPSTGRVVYSGIFRGNVDLGSGTKTQSEIFGDAGAVNSFYVTSRTR